MKSFELLNRYLIPVEATVESIKIVNMYDVVIAMGVYELNFTGDFHGEWKLPEERSAARTAIRELLRGNELLLDFRNVVYFSVDRIRGEEDPKRFLQSDLSELPTDAFRERKVIYGFSKDDKVLSERFGSYGDEFHSLVIDVVDARLIVIFRELQLPNFPAPLAQ